MADDRVQQKASLAEVKPQVSPLFLDAKATARLLGIGRSLLLALVAEGKVPGPVDFGRRRCWSLRELRVWERCGRPACSPPPKPQKTRQRTKCQEAGRR